jgi:hypothetical protein
MPYNLLYIDYKASIDAYFRRLFSFSNKWLFWVFFSFLVVTPANFSFNKNDQP